ncbi:MAG: Transcriptional regulator, LacI family [uncultured Rubrobacteraceae bacterium]|uniref:Transcriptional regulator, LacI family n=1 Tax=uncultured Rubrobacteraceae bacterium TaxID=349277 RepID=A0A6J4SVD8_9ACTN|nr:MAG: Transcriptional regulator, LacI family [uncultured Rubrobacteraceae bacterium]
MGHKEEETGRFSGGSGGRRATLARIAEELDISAMTVSNAYNHPDRLSEALRGRIFETARRLGYHGPDPVARSLRRQRTDVVGVLYSGPLSYAFEDPAAASFLSGLSSATEEADLGLLLVAAGGYVAAERHPRAAARAAVDGFVIYSMSDEEPLLAAALNRQLPAVVVDQPFREGVPFVGVDDEAAARASAEHLLRLGHGTFAVVSFALSPDVRDGLANPARQEGAAFRVSRLRLKGYRAALEDAGLSWSEVPVYECPGSSRELGHRAAGALLSPERGPTAILATSDQLALGVIARATEGGLSVPEDLSVVGFDDIPAAAAADPPLTTVSQDHAQKGRLAGRMLISHLRGEEAPSTGPLPASLVIRGSTFPPRGR